MKKILILIILLFTCTSCYDYKEINNLAIISAIGVDYDNDKYIITLELLNDQIDKDSSKITSYTKVGSGDTLTSAIESAADKLAKQPLFNHIKLMVLSDTIVQNKFDNIIDLFLRNTYFRENFYVISSMNTKPDMLLNNTTDENPVASNAITSLLENVSYSSNTNVLKKFDEIVEEVTTFGIDTCFSNIDLKETEFIINGMIIFKDYDYKETLNNDYVKLYNILRNEFDRPTFTIKYDNLDFTVAINNGKLDSSIENGVINIKGNLMGRILDNDPNFNIRNKDNLEKLDNNFSELLNEQLQEFIKTIQESGSDILGITEKYYKKTRKKDKEYWQKLDIKSNINFYINKKGLIYEVEKASWKKILIYSFTF